MAESSKIYNLIEFPLRTFSPKIQSFDEEKIQLKIHEYREMKIENCLASLDVQKCKLIPAGFAQKFVRTCAISNFHNGSSNVFALEWFDDTDDDCMLPVDWMNKCEINGKILPLPGIAFLPLLSTLESTLDLKTCSTNKSDLTAFYEWQHVAVYNYNHISNKWYIKDIKHNNSYNVPRIYLMFLAESPMNFAQRIMKAIKLRDECERNLKFNAIIDSIVFTEIPRPPQHLTKTIKEPLLKSCYNVGWIDIFEREYTVLYQKDMAAMQLKHNLHTDPHGFDFIQLPPAPQSATPKKAIMVKMVQNNGDKESFNFMKAQQKLKWLWLYCSPEPIDVMYFINKMCHTVSQMSLFATECKKTLTLIEFCDAQNKIATETMHFLKYNWNSVIATEMQVIFSDIRQGWYNMYVSDWQIYKQSKLYRMIEMVKQRMQVALRNLMECSAEAFVDLLCKPCECLLHIDVNFVWGCDLISSSFQSKCPSVFSMILNIDTNGTSYSTDPNAIESEIVKIFESTVLALHEIPQIDPFLVTRLTFDRNIKMSSIGLLDNFIQHHINHLQLCYKKSLIPLHAYAKEFEQYVEFKNININDYIKSMKSKQSQVN